MLKILSLCCVLCLSSFSAFAFGNQDVVQLLAAGMDEKTVADAIVNANPATFDTSATGLIALKNAGASPVVIQKVIARQGAANSPTKVAGSNGGSCQLESGGMPGKAPVRVDDKIVGLISSKYGLENNINMGRGILTALTAGIVGTSGTQAVVLPGNRSATRISDKTPEFIDLFELPDHAPTDRTFILRLTANDATRMAESTPVSIGVTGGKQSTGFPEAIQVPVSVERVGGVCMLNAVPVTQFRMKPSAPLQSGEYALVIGNKIFDFGVD